MASYNPDPQGIDNEYAVRRSEAIQREIPDKDKFNWQEHHDHYVKKYIECAANGLVLDAVELKQYELAMLREHQGFVQPCS